MEVSGEAGRLPPVAQLPCAKLLPAIPLSGEYLPVLRIRGVGVSRPRSQQVAIRVSIRLDLRKKTDREQRPGTVVEESMIALHLVLLRFGRFGCR